MNRASSVGDQNQPHLKPQVRLIVVCPCCLLVQERHRSVSFFLTLLRRSLGRPEMRYELLRSCGLSVSSLTRLFAVLQRGGSLPPRNSNSA